MDTTPVTLLERLRTPGGEDAWPELVALVTPLLMGWSRRLHLRHDEAADLTPREFYRRFDWKNDPSKAVLPE